MDAIQKQSKIFAMSEKLYTVRTLWASSQNVEFTYIFFTTIAYFFWICTLFRVQSLSQELTYHKKRIFSFESIFDLFFRQKEKKRLQSLLFSRIAQYPILKMMLRLQKMTKKRKINERINDTMLAYLQFENDE